jgi:predicted Zn-dependent protease
MALDGHQLLLRAESRALRLEIGARLPEGDVHVEGKLTLLSLEEAFDDQGATLKMRVHVDAGTPQPLGPEEGSKIHASRAAEHLELMEWAEAAEALERLHAGAPGDLAVVLQLADVYQKAGNPAKAAGAFGAAHQLQPDNLDLLRKQVEALRAVPDEAAAVEAEKALKAAEAKGKAKPKKKGGAKGGKP